MNVKSNLNVCTLFRKSDDPVLSSSGLVSKLTTRKYLAIATWLESSSSFELSNPSVDKNQLLTEHFSCQEVTKRNMKREMNPPTKMTYS